MANNKNAKDNLKPCKKGETNNPNGRPKKIVSAALDALRLEGEEVTAAMAQETMNVFLSLTKAKITAIANDDKQSIMFRIIARAMLKDKQFEVLNSLLDRSHGKAIQKTEVKSEFVGNILKIELSSTGVTLPKNESQIIE